MSTRNEIMDIITSLCDPDIHHSYRRHKFEAFLRSREKTQWTRDIILGFLRTAFSKGYHGIHFVSDDYLSCIEEILVHYFGNDHFLAYRLCRSHHKIILLPNYDKLGVKPHEQLQPSAFWKDHNMEEPTAYADFCFE